MNCLMDGHKCTVRRAMALHLGYLSWQGWGGLEVDSSVLRNKAVGCSALSASRGVCAVPTEATADPRWREESRSTSSLAGVHVWVEICGLYRRGQDHTCPQAFTTQDRGKQERGKKNTVIGCGGVFVFGLFYKVFNKIINYNKKEKCSERMRA